MVEVFREVRRVLRDDGVVWLNYGDCYGGSWGNYGSREGGQRGVSEKQLDRKAWTDHTERPAASFLKQGNLMMMPHRVALALQADGWIVRGDPVWYKRNPMPESINGTRWVKHRIKEKRSEHARKHNIKGGTQKMLEDASVHQGINEDWVPKYVDCPGCEKCIPNDGLVLKRGSWRHTRAHEYVFMLTKKMQYFSNQEAAREKVGEFTRRQKTFRGGIYVGGRLQNESDVDYSGHEPFSDGEPSLSGRNPRSVLDVPTAPYRGAHYATFPPNLIAPLIRATCPRRCCPICGQGWAAVVNQAFVPQEDVSLKKGIRGHEGQKPAAAENRWDRTPRGSNQNSVFGYRPTCNHPHTQEEAVPGICFDPFVGSGTTVKVAQDLLRRGIGIDLSMEYLDLQAKVRIGQGSPSNVLDDLPLFQ